MNTADAAAGFRQRLQSLIDGSGLNQAAFARMAEIDRSTLSQLLSADGPRIDRKSVV